MEKYRAIYRCRACGKVFLPERCNEKIIRKAMAEFAFNESLHSKRCGTGMNAHECENGDIGFTDFVGFRKVED